LRDAYHPIETLYSGIRIYGEEFELICHWILQINPLLPSRMNLRSDIIALRQNIDAMKHSSILANEEATI